MREICTSGSVGVPRHNTWGLPDVKSGFADCNADPSNADSSDGCETNLLNERVNCGQRGRVCIIGKCKAGTCEWKP